MVSYVNNVVSRMCWDDHMSVVLQNILCGSKSLIVLD